EEHAFRAAPAELRLPLSRSRGLHLQHEWACQGRLARTRPTHRRVRGAPVRRRLAACLALAASVVVPATAAARTPTTPIRHIVVLMQENHSFDNYFGTYRGADGLPAGTCLPRSLQTTVLGCSRPSRVGG